MVAPDSGEPPPHPLAEIDRTIHSPARLMVMTNLYVVESAEFIALMHLTGLSWGNLSTHLAKLDEAGYVETEKGFRGKKPYTMIRLTAVGRAAFQAYKNQIQQALADLPD
ncbi:MAG: transcriptional regulator [Acidobacteria bacterium]|jgi:DNA-binding MarR family transcriptional regulator|nr:transcriptional regulator [Acidobacteriota bacterium]